MASNDMETGKGAWVNVAQIVRQTFVTIFQTLRSQHERIKDLERGVITDREERKHENGRLLSIVQNATGGPSALLHERDQRISQLESEVQHLRSKLDELFSIIPKKDDLQRVLSKKVDVKTLETAFQEFPDRSDIVSIVDEVRIEMNAKLGQLELRMENQISESLGAIGSSQDEVEFLRNAVTSEMLLARWLWEGDRSGITAWAETMNTSQLMFECLSEPAVRILRKGIYEVNFGFFPLKDSSRDALIQFLLNEQLIFTNEPGASTVPHGLQKNVKKANSIKTVTGWTCCEYLAIPADAEIAIRFRGDRCRGFLHIKNLYCDSLNEEG